MKEQMLKILRNLNMGRITVSEAQEQLLDLFDVSGSLPSIEHIDEVFNETFPKITSLTAGKWAKIGFEAGIKLFFNNYR